MNLPLNKILLIDKGAANAAAIRFALSTVTGGDLWNLTWVNSLSEGLSILTQQTMNVILLGLSLPEGGMQAFLELKNQSQLPVIIFSSADDENQAAQLLHAGAQDFLVNGQITGRALVRSLRSAIERQSILRTLDERTREIELLYEAGQALSRTLDLDQLYETFLNILKKLMPCDHLFISSYEPASQMIYCVFAMTENIILDPSKFPPVHLEPEGKGSQSKVIRSGKSLLCEDWQAMTRTIETRYYIGDDGSVFTPDQIPEEEDITRSGIIVPIIFQDQVVGAIQILSIKLNGYTENDLRIAEALAAQIAVAANNAILYNRARFELDERRRAEADIKQQVERLMAISEIERTIGSSAEINENFPVLINQLRTCLHVDAVLILLVDPVQNDLVYTISSGFNQPGMENMRIKIGIDRAGSAYLEEKRISLVSLESPEVNFTQKVYWQAEGFQSFYSTPLIAKGSLQGVVEAFTRSPFDADFQWLEFFETLARQLSLAISEFSLFKNLQQSNLDLQQAYDATIQGWSNALDLRDKETEGHSIRVTDLTYRVAQQLGFSEEDLLHIRRGALLHDIGKMGVPDQILLKPGPLTDEEWVQMRKHPTYGYQLLLPIDYLKKSLEIPRSHHEKWDGTGYPEGLQGEEIPLAARIFSVVDVYDALGSDRPYRKPWPKEKIIAHIQSLSGSAFEPRIVDAFIKMISEE